MAFMSNRSFDSVWSTTTNGTCGHAFTLSVAELRKIVADVLIDSRRRLGAVNASWRDAPCPRCGYCPTAPSLGELQVCAHYYAALTEACEKSANPLPPLRGIRIFVVDVPSSRAFVSSANPPQKD
jgi:hypothetical protein